MKPLNKILFLLISVIFFSGECSKDSGGCDKCDDAINYLYNLMQNSSNCNAVLMPDAIDKINTSCGQTSGRIYMGFMAEKCYRGIFTKPSCSSHGELSLSNVSFLFQKTTTTFNNIRVDIELPFTTPVNFGVTMTQDGVEYLETLLGVPLTEGDIIKFNVLFNGMVVGTGQKKFTFDRLSNNGYGLLRKVYLDQSGNSMQVSFKYW